MTLAPARVALGRMQTSLRHGVPKFRSPKLRSPKLPSPKLRSPEFRSPKLRLPEFRSPKLRSPKLRSPGFRSPKPRSAQEATGTRRESEGAKSVAARRLECACRQRSACWPQPPTTSRRHSAPRRLEADATTCGELTAAGPVDQRELGWVGTGGQSRKNTEQIKQNANWMQLLIPRYLEVLLCNFTLLVFCWTY